MTDEEKIEQAANALAGAHEDADRYYAFLAGVKWRDENPSPKVLDLVEALKKLEIGYLESVCDACGLVSSETFDVDIAIKALAEWEKK